MNKVLCAVMLAFLFMACSLPKNDGYDEYREIAWKYIDGDHDHTIIGGQYDGKIEVATYGPDQIPAVGVSWNTIDDMLLGPIMVYVSIETKEVLGMGLRF